MKKFLAKYVFIPLSVVTIVSGVTTYLLIYMVEAILFTVVMGAFKVLEAAVSVL